MSVRVRTVTTIRCDGCTVSQESESDVPISMAGADDGWTDLLFRPRGEDCKSALHRGHFCEACIKRIDAFVATMLRDAVARGGP